jgi:hypothetical protein
MAGTSSARSGQQGQAELVAIVAQEQSVAGVRRKDCDDHGKGQYRSGRTYQQTDDQGQSTKELGAGGEKGHQVAGLQAD